MKTLLLTIFLATQITGLAFAGSGSAAIITERARNLSNQGERQEPGASPPAAAPKPAAPAQPVQPVLTPAQQAVRRVQTDISGIRTNTAVTPEQKRKLLTDLTASVTGPARPSPASLEKLANDLTASLVEKKLTSQQQAKLTQEITALLGHATVTDTQKQAIVADVRSILQAGDNKGADAVAGDLKTIVAELQKAAAK